MKNIWRYEKTSIPDDYNNWKLQMIQYVYVFQIPYEIWIY